MDTTIITPRLYKLTRRPFKAKSHLAPPKPPKAPPPPHLDRLPFDIVATLTPLLSRSDHLNLTRCSHKMHQLFSPALYKDIKLQEHSLTSIFYGLEPEESVDEAGGEGSDEIELKDNLVKVFSNGRFRKFDDNKRFSKLELLNMVKRLTIVDRSGAVALAISLDNDYHNHPENHPIKIGHVEPGEEVEEVEESKRLQPLVFQNVTTLSFGSPFIHYIYHRQRSQPKQMNLLIQTFSRLLEPIHFCATVNSTFQKEVSQIELTINQIISSIFIPSWNLQSITSHGFFLLADKWSNITSPTTSIEKIRIRPECQFTQNCKSFTNMSYEYFSDPNKKLKNNPSSTIIRINECECILSMKIILSSVIDSNNIRENVRNSKFDLLNLRCIPKIDHKFLSEILGVKKSKNISNSDSYPQEIEMKIRARYPEYFDWIIDNVHMVSKENEVGCICCDGR